nr:MAG TPA: hypothetical protein [Microviridae sp.]
MLQRTLIRLNFSPVVQPYGCATFILFVMGFLNTLGQIGSAASHVGATTSAVGGLLGLGKGIVGMFGNDQKKQMNQQKELMNYQNELNRKNSLLDYNRQRELTADNAMLQKIGLRKAGMNTALGDGSVASAASTGSTPGTTTPSALPTQSSVDSQYLSMINDASSSLSSSALQGSQKQLVDSQRHSQDIKNAFEIDRQIAEVESLHKANKISDAEYDTRMENLKRLQDTHDAFVKQEDEKANQAEKDTQIKDIQLQQEDIKKGILSVTKQLNEEQLKQAQFVTEHQLERFTKEMEEVASRIKANDASAAASLASAAASRAHAMATNIQNKLEAAKIPFADKLATYYATSAMNAAKLAGVQFDHAKLSYDTDKEWHSSQSQTYRIGEFMRNLLSGWFSFSSSVSVTKSFK